MEILDASGGHVPDLFPCSIDGDDYVRGSKTQKIHVLTHANAILHPILLPLYSTSRICWPPASLTLLLRPPMKWQIESVANDRSCS